MNRLIHTLWVVACLAAAAPVRAQPAGNAAKPAEAPGKLTKAPRLLHFVDPELPPDVVLTSPVAVVLKLSIAADGSVSAAEVAEPGNPVYDEAARAAALKLTFEPAEIDGAPAPVRITYRYELKPVAPKPALHDKARFSGIVHDQNGKPLPGVRVELDTGESAVTGDDGRFVIVEVPPGNHPVTLSGPTFTPIGTEETFQAGKTYDANYEVQVTAVALPGEERADFEIVVVAARLGSKVTATEVSSDQGARVAGTGGDVVKVVENLPGVARSTVGSGQLVVWGASGQDTRVYVDGVRVPVLYHEGGYRSVVHSDLVRSVELQPGGYGASYGRGIGGLVTVGLKPLEEPGFHGSMQLDAIDASASIRARLADKWHLAVGARRSHLDWVLSRVTSEDVGQFVPIPRYWDGQARLSYTPREGQTLEIGTLLSEDKINRTLSTFDPADSKSESKAVGFSRAYFRYRHEDERGTAVVTPYIGFDHSKILSRFGAVPAELRSNSTLYGLRAAYSTSPATFLSVNVGLDAEVSMSSLFRAGSLTTPAREGDLRVFGQLPADQVNADSWTVTVGGLAPYVEGDFSAFSDRLHIVPGLRIEPQFVRVSRLTPTQANVPPIGGIREDMAVDPRIAIRFAASDRVTFKAAAGIYHQPPLPDDLSAVFGNPTLGPATARHYLAGGAFRISKPLSLEVTSFYSNSSGLVVRSPLPTPSSAQALIQNGRGRAYGTQFLLRYDLVDRFFGWMSASIIRSERTDSDGQWRLFDFDQTFVFTALGSYDLGRGFEVGSRFRYSSGYPRTPIAIASYDTRVDAFVPIFGAHNSIRIPAFYALDVRFAKRFKFAEKSELELYLDVQNVTKHDNAEEIVYNFDYTRRSYITGLPILPVIGGKLTW
ncbi:MAG: TonB family protein [Myxococcota bacterium]